MQFEQFFETLSTICMKVLPLLGVVLLVYLIIMVHHLIQTLKSATKTFDEVNMQIRKLDVPLNTVSEISKSVDHVHELTKESLNQLSVTIFEALNALKKWWTDFIHKKNKENHEEVGVCQDEQGEN